MATVINLMPDDNPAGTLAEWLADKPFEWGPAIATRAALRVLPWCFARSSGSWVDRYALPVFHSLFLAWSTFTRPVKGHKLSAELSSNLLYQAAMFHEPEAFYASGMRNIALAIAAKTKVHKIDRSIRALTALNNLVRMKRIEGFSEDFFWKSVDVDVQKLNSMKRVKNVNVRGIMYSSIVADVHRLDWHDITSAASEVLIKSEETNKLWTSWFSGLMSTSKFNFFALDDDLDAEKKDRVTTSQIIQELNPQFWSRPARVVNQELLRWIESAEPTPGPEVYAETQIPPQNENVISFNTNDAGRIELSGSLYYDALRDDDETVDRYNECRSIAQDVLERCAGSNAASRLMRMLENYIEAAGSDIASVRPSLFVQRGERLRQELLAHQAHDTLLPPLSDDILLDLRAWQAAHNMLVGLDPALMARDTAILGPDVRVANVPPDEIKKFAIDADNSGILAEDVASVIVEAADLAPKMPDPSNRRTIWSFETGRNLTIEAFNLALRHPGKSAIGGIVAGAALGTLGFGGTIVSLAAGSIPAARFLLRHREWIETRLGDSPTWQSLFNTLCEWLAENTPLTRE